MKQYGFRETEIKDKDTVFPVISVSFKLPLQGAGGVLSAFTQGVATGLN